MPPMPPPGPMGPGGPGAGPTPPPMPPPPPPTRKRGMKVHKPVTRKTTRKGKARTTVKGRKATRKIRGA